MVALFDGEIAKFKVGSRGDSESTVGQADLSEIGNVGGTRGDPGPLALQPAGVVPATPMGNKRGELLAEFAELRKSAEMRWQLASFGAETGRMGVF